MSVKLLTEHHLDSLSLKGGCTGSPESTLVQMPHCWKLHVAAQMYQSIIETCPYCRYDAMFLPQHKEYECELIPPLYYTWQWH